MTIKDQILQILEETKTPHKYMHHDPAETSEEVAKIRGTDPKIGAKALMIKSKQKYYQIVIPATLKLDSRKFRDASKLSKFRFISPDELKELFNLEKGAVPPFGNLLDIEQTFYDKKLLDFPELAFNIGTRTDSIQIKSSDLIKLVPATLIENITE